MGGCMKYREKRVNRRFWPTKIFPTMGDIAGNAAPTEAVKKSTFLIHKLCIFTAGDSGFGGIFSSTA
jgi:hypothetical protein